MLKKTIEMVISRIAVTCQPGDPFAEHHQAEDGIWRPT